MSQQSATIIILLSLILIQIVLQFSNFFIIIITTFILNLNLLDTFFSYVDFYEQLRIGKR